MARFRPTHLHVRSGKLYQFAAYGRAEADLMPMAAYFDDAGEWWFRARKLFDQPERFAPVATCETPAGMIHAWVIECGGSKPDRPLYMSGVDGLGRFKWAYDAADAVRFSRRVDAEAVAAGDTLTTKHRICEHGWIEASPAPAGAGAG